MNTFFSSDYHFYHTNIIRYQSRPFDSVDEMNQGLIDNNNSVVGKKDTLYIVGDIAIGATPLEIANILNQMNGRKILIVGNHDIPFLKHADFTSCFAEIHHLLSIKLNKQYIQLCHYPLEIWDRAHYGSWMLHGHCVDLQTEILTTDGWKFRHQLSNSDIIYNINKTTGLVENDTISIIDNYYTGGVISYEGKSVSLRVTDNHTLVGYDIKDRWIELPAKDIFNTHCIKFIRNSMYHNTGINLGDELIRLYVYCTADGSLKKETNLWRIRVKKEHKKTELRRCLTALNIDFKEHYTSDDYVSFNFYTPTELLDFSPKGLDKKLLQMNNKQFSIFLNAYSLSDGCKNGPGVLIFTSKLDEMNIISHLAVINGYGCTTSSRIHGFGKKTSFQLSLYPRNTNLVKDKSKFLSEQVSNEHFWCVNTHNGNFFIRRNGKIHVTGNCHGNFADNPNKLRIDVGVDAQNYKPVSFDDVTSIMEKKEYVQYIRPHNRNRE